MSSFAFAKSGTKTIEFSLKSANRHGLIAGATGTGKTVSLRVLAEAFSESGVPVFLADIKGDLGGIANAGGEHKKVQERIKELKLKEFTPSRYPVIFWDILGASGHPVRASISEIGAPLLSRILGLNDTQSSILTLVFKIADDNGLLLLDLKDLKAIITHVSENAKEYSQEYGNIAPASIATIQRAILGIESEGAEHFFGEPSLNVQDFFQTIDGKGVINILNAQALINSPKIYATFLLWMLSELYENLPEVGDLEKPKFAFFFDEAHLLFDECPKALEDKIEQVVRLIRSKGVGIYFITQNPMDIPQKIASQLGNRIVHGLRAFSPAEKKNIDAIADTFRENPKLDVKSALLELETGEAVVSVLDEKGMPSIAQRAFVFPPKSSLAPLDGKEIAAAVKNSPIFGYYEQAIDRESAFEILKGKASSKVGGIDIGGILEGEGGKILKTVARSAMYAIGSSIGRKIARGILGSILK